ncbi:related to SYP1 Protein with a potential role in actin cytoskeletal organization [Phialocephala subalpina]|uniref:Related to SYP1 Protein with a potential role in actin cytoskeletal organization n=1 Tax=Phialocephala subalpina TaxID=576137 RepID=A0A1L7XAX4_9HELO|nr:related to SYP1 Protein with a potential role in actin cytoskeletal organization [Phialocephala subalpina]
MEALSRQEYPAMLERLQPAGAVQKFNERVKRIGKVNSEIADWLLERRKVEQAYVAGLKKLAQKPLQESQGELGIFEGPWKRIVQSTDEIAKSHALLADRIDKDVEQPLRSFASTNREMSGMPTIQGNLHNMAKELDDAQTKSDKLSSKGGKANALKVDQATSRLQTASQQWEAQAPFIMENLQALDERRLNHLRDVLTQYETHEADLVERNRKTVEETLTSLLEIDTSQEIRNWAAASVQGLSITERRARQLSSVGTEHTGNASLPLPPQTPRSTHTTHTDNQSEHSQPTRQDTIASKEGKEVKESKNLKSRFGTMLGGGKRRSSIGPFGRSASPNKGFVAFGRGTSSRDGRPSPSPRTSSNNLRESPPRDNRLSSLAESPTATSPARQTNGTVNNTHTDSAFITDSVPGRSNVNGPTAADLFDMSDVQPPEGPPPSQQKAAMEVQKDSEGFSVPAPMNDPISQAESDAQQENDEQRLKFEIGKEPIPEQDADAQAALSNVANTLRSAVTPNRKAGTVRGRRDVRNTMYVPTPSGSLGVASPDSNIPPSPGISAARAGALAALSSENHGASSISDTTSIRSGHSLTSHAVMKHADGHEPGLNASIIETMSASFEDGQTKSMKINGEIALSHNPADDFSSSAHDTIRIDNFPNLESIGPNRTFINPVSDEKPDEFAINLFSLTPKATPAFTYRVHIDDTDITTHGPLLINAVWPKQGTDKRGLLLEYSLNPACSTKPITFNNLVLVAFYQGARASQCQTKPTGTHLKEKSLVYWRLGDVALTQEKHKIICRFVGTEGAVPEPGHIEARWEINNPAVAGIGSGISLSKFEPSKGKEKETAEDDPFADETMSPTTASPTGTWKEIATHRKLVSGKYEARQVASA